jgi:hypothetical protein
LIGVPLGGQILQVAEGDYLGLILFAGLAYAIALVGFVVVRLMGGKESGTKKF